MFQNSVSMHYVPSVNPPRKMRPLGAGDVRRGGLTARTQSHVPRQDDAPLNN